MILHDPKAGVIACVHAGWGGTVHKVAAAAVAAMAELGSGPVDVLAVVGPAIEPGRYQVGDDVKVKADEAFGPAARGVVRPDGTGRWLSTSEPPTASR